jgi:hypothetical protein
VLCQIFIFVLLLFLAKPSTAGLLLLFGLLHGNAGYSPSIQRREKNPQRLTYGSMLTKEKSYSFEDFT